MNSSLAKGIALKIVSMQKHHSFSHFNFPCTGASFSKIYRDAELKVIKTLLIPQVLPTSPIKKD